MTWQAGLQFKLVAGCLAKRHAGHKEKHLDFFGCVLAPRLLGPSEPMYAGHVQAHSQQNTVRLKTVLPTPSREWAKSVLRVAQQRKPTAEVVAVPARCSGPARTRKQLDCSLVCSCVHT